MLFLNNICLSFGERDLFKSITCTIESGDKIGLVGNNGAGKSTLLKVISKMQQVDEGSISLERGKKIAYMPQEVVLESSKTILDEALGAFAEIQNLQIEAKELEARLSDLDDPNYDAVVERYSDILQELSLFDTAHSEVQAKRMLTGLGFKQEQFDKPVNELSVGWKMRIVLAKLLLQKADVYLFDEPTNHLDIVAQGWFLDFLKAADFAFVLVSHDRYFLDHVCKKIYEVERGNLTIYTSNYTKYLAQKEHNQMLLERAYEAQQKEIKHKMEIINKFRASAARASTAQSMLKQLEKIERIEIGPKPPKVQFSFPPVQRSGDVVLKVREISKAFDSKQLFKNVDFDIFRGEKVALVAANGVGKTTLLSIIMGKETSSSGTYEFGYNVQPVYFEQDQNKTLNKNKTILQEIEDSCTTSAARTRARSLLGAFLFPGDDVDKKISVLSGGERNRVAMVKVLLAHGNFLLLDEPTNHLDLQSKDILASAIKAFDGTVLFVSHDRTFLDEIATRVLELTPTAIRSYKGNYESFVFAKEQEAKKETPLSEKKQSKKESTAEPKQKEPAESDYERRKKISALESKIERIEKELKQLELKFAECEWGTDEYKKAEKLYLSKKQELEAVSREWEALS